MELISLNNKLDNITCYIDNNNINYYIIIVFLIIIYIKSILDNIKRIKKYEDNIDIIKINILKMSNDILKMTKVFKEVKNLND
tara:strand:- start:386 stop:634 length:249 start_codon:yes stop_codon:yes gene_type:complete